MGGVWLLESTRTDEKSIRENHWIPAWSSGGKIVIEMSLISASTACEYES